MAQVIDINDLLDQIKLTRARKTGKLILELDLGAALLEVEASDPVARFQHRNTPSLRAVTKALHDAADDDRVTGLIATIGIPAMGWAQRQEVRDAVAAFRASGKPTVAWAESFGEIGMGTGAYYLATAFETIMVQSTGDVAITGLSTVTWFLAGALEKAGIDYAARTRHEYKTFANKFTQTGYNEPHRESMSAMLDSLTDQVVAAIAESRGLDVEVVRDLIQKAPLTPDDALAAGLVDALGYRDEAYARIREAAGGDEPLLQYAGRYHRTEAPTRPNPFAILKGVAEPKAPVVAQINVVGGIASGKGGASPMGRNVGATAVCAALDAAGRADHVKAVVLRVDSPGGSAVASDSIWRSVMRLKDSGRPVVASMGNVAASGGYYVSAGATKIVAQPGTITGSIGVVFGKPVTAELLDRLGVSVDRIEQSPNADMLALSVPFDDENWAVMERGLDRTYDTFLDRVADGRGMSRDDVHKVAKGRVWTGAEAHERGLVDVLGGLRDATALARELAELDADAEVVTFPKSSPLDALRSPESSEDPAAAAAMQLTSSLVLAGFGLLPAFVRTPIAELGALLAGADGRVQAYTALPGWSTFE